MPQPHRAVYRSTVPLKQGYVSIQDGQLGLTVLVVQGYKRPTNSTTHHTNNCTHSALKHAYKLVYTNV